MNEMLPLHLLDDATVEALLAGEPVPPELEPLAEVVQEIRSAAENPVEPTAELAERVAAGNFADLAPAAIAYPPGKHRVRARLAAMSLRTRVAAGAAVMFTGLTGATAAGALPEPAQERVESIIESVSPISFPDRTPPSAEVIDQVGEDTDGHETGERAEEHSRRSEQSGSSPSDPPAPGENRPDKPEKPAEKPDARAEKPDAPPEKPDRPAQKPDPAETPDAPADKPDTPPEKPAPPREKPGKPPERPDTPADRPDTAGRAPEGPPVDRQPETSEERSADAPAMPPAGKPETRPTGPDR